MRQVALAALLALGCAAPASCASQAPEALVSWGKPEVTLLQYWTDSAECGAAGARQGYRATAQARAAESAHQAEVAQCLSRRGYRPFQLTSAQASELAARGEGSRERREYLHRLGSDPEVLTAQGL